MSDSTLADVLIAAALGVAAKFPDAVPGPGRIATAQAAASTPAKTPAKVAATPPKTPATPPAKASATPAKTAAKPPKAAKAAASKYNPDQVRAQVRLVVNHEALGKQAAFDLLEEAAGVKNVADLKPEQLDGVYAACQSALDAADGGADAGGGGDAGDEDEEGHDGEAYDPTA